MTSTRPTWGTAWASDHKSILTDRAIVPDVAEQRGYLEVFDKAQLERVDFTPAQRRVPGILIPLHGVDQQVIGFQYRPDNPRTRDGRKLKYENRPGRPVMLDVPPATAPNLDDPTVDLWITEGPLKADAAVSAGLNCIALLGVWGWRGTNSKGGKTALAAFEQIAWNDRNVILAFDSDSATKVSVYDALTRLAQLLTNRGANVRYCHLPDGGDGKTGLDDYLAAGHTTEDLGALIDDELGERPSPPASEPTGHDGHHLTDLGNAHRLIAQHGEHLRYVPEWGQWIVWDETRFVIDTGDLRVTDLAADVPRKLWAQVPDLSGGDRDKHVRWATRSESAASLGASVKLARTLPGIAITPDVLDCDRWALNVENGTLNLRAGTLRPHNPEDLNTQMSGTRWEPEPAAPVFHKFLREILPDAEVRDYVQRSIGYTLTGDVSEQVLLIATGGGANGKSTLIGAMLQTLGDYGVTAPKDLLVQTRHEPHPTSMTRLYRARMAAAVETELGAKLAEAQIKQLTGGDQITARRMREDYWSFDPTHKLWVGCNALPRISGSDHAIWRRIRVIPFDVVIPPEDRDPHLADKLKTELPGILAWAVEGCAKWQQHGLTPPPAVEQATRLYRAEQDWFSRFCDDKGWELTPGYGTQARSIIGNDYRDWCHAEGVQPLSPKALAKELQLRGIEAGKSNGQRLWKGISRGE